MPINDPGIGVVAAPIGTFVRPAVPEALQVADALAQLNPRLTGYLRVQSEQEIDRALEEGRQRAIQDAADWQDRTVRGEARIGENHWFRRAYRQQAGQNTGRRIAQEATAAYQEWAGRDSDEPRAFQQWLGGFIRERTQDIHDRDVIQGLQPELQVLTNNLGQVHQAYTAERVAREGADTITNAVIEGLRDSRNGPLDLQTGNIVGDFDPQIAMRQYEEMKQRYFATGIPYSRFDELYTDAVIGAATADLDVSYLDVLTMRRSDGTPPISMKAGMAERIADARQQIESRAASREIRERQTAIAARQEQAQQAYQAAATELLSTGQVSQETQTQIASLAAAGVVDPREFRELMNAFRTGVGEMNDGITQSDADMPPDFLSAVYDRGDVRAVYQAWNDGTITDRDYMARALRSAVSRREGEQGQDISRANLQYRAEDETRSAISRSLLGTFQQIYGNDQAGQQAARNALNSAVDAYVPWRARLVDQYASDNGVSPDAAALEVDSYVRAYVNGITVDGQTHWLTPQEFEQEFGPGSSYALVPFNQVRRENSNFPGNRRSN